MPRACKLCSHKRRAELDAFILHGTSYKMFRKKFGLRSISVYCWSRHRNHLADKVQERTPDADPALSDGLNVQTLRRLNKRLWVLGAKAEKSGRPQNAVSCYAAVSRNLELLAKLSEQQKGEAESAASLTPEQIEIQFVDALRDSRVSQWVKACLFRAGDKSVFPRIAVIRTPDLIRELIGNGGIRERCRRALLEAEAKVTGNNLTSDDYVSYEDLFPDACDGDANVYYRGEPAGEQ